MTRILKSLLGNKKPQQPTVEELEAMRAANEALQFRVNMIARQGLSRQLVQRTAA
jgi:hypothetical protein